MLGPWAVLVAVGVGVAAAVLAPSATRAFLAALRDNLTGARPPVESVAERLTALGNEQLTSELVATSLPNPRVSGSSGAATRQRSAPGHAPADRHHDRQCRCTSLQGGSGGSVR